MNHRQRSTAAVQGWDTRRLNMSGWGNPLRLGEPEREGCIYLLRNLINGKGYVGKSIQKDIRWNVHRKAAFSGRSTLAIHRAIRKYGWNNFSAEVVY
jgi:hypothetical protein